MRPAQRYTLCSATMARMARMRSASRTLLALATFTLLGCPAKLPEQGDRHNTQRIEYATLALARAAGLRVCGARLERVGQLDVLLLERFDREWNPQAKTYCRFGLVSALTLLDAEDGHLGRERWSYPLLADELRRWSAKSAEDRRELFRRMVFNAMVTNNDDHPRNHAMLHTRSGWRLSPAYDRGSS